MIYLFRHSPKAIGLSTLLVQACLTILSTALVLRLWRADLINPFNYWGDTVFELALVKSIADGNWIWYIDRLGAPFGLEIVAFPQNITFSSLVMKAIALFTSEPGLILNVFWISAIILTSLMCHLALRSLSISRASSLFVSTLYALLPYALYRNTAHISLTYIFVPVIAAFAVEVLTFSSRVACNDQEIQGVPRVLLFASSVAIGFDYVYNAFFACFFLVAAGATGAAYGKRWQSIRQVVPAIVLICLCALINIFPSLVSWRSNGVPPSMAYKNAAEAEIYGLKIRHVLTPLSNISIMGQSAQSQPVNFPLENENQTAKLGVVGAFGFLLALIYGLVGSRQGKGTLSWSAGVLTIVGTLLATIGGFGAIFNLLVVPDIRAYNRIIVFLAFFAFLVLALQLDVIRLKIKKFFNDWGKPVLGSFIVGVMLLCIFLIGLADQGQAAVPLVARYAVDKAQANEEREIVRKIELLRPHVGNVYQLPETIFPNDVGLEQMLTYDHGRPYLWSQRINWSWPSFSRKRDDWAGMIGLPTDERFIANLLIAGFDGLWLDRFGYTPAAFSRVEAGLIAATGKPVVTSSSGRYLFFRLQDQRKERLATGTDADRQQARESLLESIRMEFDQGFYAEEVSVNGQRRHRWSQSMSAARVINPSVRARRVEFHAFLSSNTGGFLRIKSGAYSATVDLKNGSNALVLPIQIAPRSSSQIEFSYEGSKVEAPGDPRSMYFAIVNSTVKEVNN